MSGCEGFGSKKNTSGELERELNKNFYSGLFQPSEPMPFNRIQYVQVFKDDCFDSNASNESRKVCWLESLPNSEDFVAVASFQFKGDIGFASSSVSKKNESYKIISQWARYVNVTPKDSEGNAMEGYVHKIGVGARIVAHIKTSEAGINLTDLFAVAAAAEANKVSGSLLFTIQGIHGKGIDTYTPKIAKLDTDNLKKALDSVLNIKALLHHDDNILITPQIIATLSPEMADLEGRIESTPEKEELKKSLGFKNQGWVYVGYFDSSGEPISPTNLVVNNASGIKEKEVLTTRANLTVRSGHPTPPFYKMRTEMDTVTAGTSVLVVRVANVGINKYWALIEY